MGPYYRGTSQGMGAFFNLFYEHPLLMVILAVAAVGTGIYFWRKKRSEENSYNGCYKCIKIKSAYGNYQS